MIKEREEKGCIWEAHKGFETKTKLQMKMLGQADSWSTWSNLLSSFKHVLNWSVQTFSLISTIFFSFSQFLIFVWVFCIVSKDMMNLSQFCLQIYLFFSKQKKERNYNSLEKKSFEILTLCLHLNAEWTPLWGTFRKLSMQNKLS